VPVPGTDVLQLFYRGTDSAVWTRWRDPDGTWSDEQRVGRVPGRRLRRRVHVVGDPVASALPGTDVLQLFYRGTDSALWTRWRDPDGTWSNEQRLGGTLVADPIAAALPGTRVLQLFYRGIDSAIWTRWRNADGTWSDEQRLGGVVINGPIAAVPPGTRVLQLFYRGTDSAIWTRWRNADGTWSDAHALGGVVHMPAPPPGGGQPFAMVASA
jgi:hypothetical protein